MARLVAAIPWIVAQDGAPVDEIAERFDYPRDLLLADLQDVVFFVGVPPYTPDTLIEVIIDEDMVWISYADWFARPMKLSGGELLTLLTAGETALSFDNQDEAGALARGLAKLRLATGTSDTIDVQLGSIDRTFLPVLRSAADARLCVDIDYYSFASNSQTTRRIEPDRFFVADGNWYVGGYCHVAAGERLFRVDRIHSVGETSQTFSQPLQEDGAAEPRRKFSIDEAPRVTIALPSHRMRVLDGLPFDELAADKNGELVVSLPVSSARWLEQLVLRIGPGVRLVNAGEFDIDPADPRERMLSRYGASEASQE